MVPLRLIYTLPNLGSQWSSLKVVNPHPPPPPQKKKQQQQQQQQQQQKKKKKQKNRELKYLRKFVLINWPSIYVKQLA